MKSRVFLAAAVATTAMGLLGSVVAHSQPADVWSNMPSASDDRFSNPKSKLYAGPNGWHNFGEVRAVVANPAKTAYSFKTGLNYISTPEAFMFASNAQTRTLVLDFGTDKPAPGVYEASAKPNPTQKKVAVAFADVSGNKLLEWASADKAGAVTVGLDNGYRYFKARDLRLAPRGLHNTGDLKHPMTLGLEGAVAPEK